MDIHEINELTVHDDFSSFDCEDEDLNEFIKEDAKRYHETHFARTYVYRINAKPIAFSSLCIDSVKSRSYEIIESQKRKIIPALKLARLAVDKEYKGQKIGQALLYHSIYHAFEINRDHAACRLLIVDSKPGIEGYYTQYGFTELPSGKKDYKTLYLDLMTINPRQYPF